MALETVQVEKNKVKGTKTKVLAAAERDADNTNCKMDECCQKYEQIELNLNEQISAVVGVLPPAAFQEKKLEVESCLSYPTPKESLLPPKESILYVPAEGAAESSSNEDNTNATINSIPPNKSGVPVSEEGAAESSSKTDASATADSDASNAFLDFLKKPSLPGDCIKKKLEVEHAVCPTIRRENLRYLCLKRALLKAQEIMINGQDIFPGRYCGGGGD